MIRKVVLVLVWFPATFVLLTINLALLISIDKSRGPGAQEAYSYPTIRRITATSHTAQIIGATIIPGDARALLVAKFLHENNSPLAPYSDTFVNAADANGLDYRLLPAIAKCESDAGNHIPGKSSHNPFGIAVYTGQEKGRNFGSWEEAIIWASRYVKERYYDQGITTLKEINRIWSPPTARDESFSWKNCVEEYIGSIL